MTSWFRREPCGSDARLRAPAARSMRCVGLISIALLAALVPGGCPSAESPIVEQTIGKADTDPISGPSAQPSTDQPLDSGTPPSTDDGGGDGDGGGVGGSGGGGANEDGGGAPGDDSDDGAGSLAPTVSDVRAVVFEGDDVMITLDGRAPSAFPLTFTLISAPQSGRLGPIVRLSDTRAEVRYSAAAAGDSGTQFSFQASDGFSTSNVGTAVVTVHPQVYFNVAPLDGPRGVPVQVSAHTSGGRPLPSGVYSWHFDEQIEAGSAETHAARSTSFAIGGVHSVRLELMLQGANGAAECPFGAAASDTVAAVTVWPRISGRVVDSNGMGLPGAAVTADGQPTATATTGADGSFALDVPVLWAGSVRVARTGYMFAPTARAYSFVFADVEGADFVGTAVATNRPPVANSQSVTTTEATARAITLSGSDADGDALTYIVAGLPAHGALRDDGSGATISAGQLPYTLPNGGRALTYTPTAGYSGADSFTFCVHDGQASSAGASVSISVQALSGALAYVDPQLGSASCTTYNVATRSCGGGSATAYRTLAGAAAAAQPGHTVLLRGGTYAEQLRPARSGTAAQPIAFRAYPAETPTISGASLSPAIDISDRSWLVIEGLRVNNVRRWVLAVNAHHNILRGNTFERAVDSGGSARTGVFFEASTYNQVLDNVLDDSTQDNLALVQSDRNLVEGNTITNANHALFTIKCGSYNILRGNYFHNPRQKIGEAYDCDGVGVDHDIFAMNATRYNVIEENVFNFTPSSGNASPFAGIQYAAQYGIIRRNVFYDTTGPALDMTLYGAEAEYNTHNRAYNNVFHGTDFAGIAIPGSGFNFTGNQFKNNVLYRSTFVRNDTRWDWYIELNGKPVQILMSRLDGFVFDRNCIFHTTAGQTYTITHGSRFNTNNGTQRNVAWWQTNHPTVFANNVELDPRFVDAAGRDYHLRSDSPMIDTAAALTRTVGAGSGTTMRVEDSGFFCEGFGIAGEVGDEIQLAGQTASVRVIAIDRATHTLTLSGPLTWTSGQGVSLKFAGAGADLGALEFGQD